jgi:hypothetical protein
MRDQLPINIEDFMGLFDRGPNENCPSNYFINCGNIEFVYRGFRTRGEFQDLYTFSAISCDILGLYVFPRLDGTTRRLILARQIGGGNPVKLYDIDHAVPPFLVATFATDIDSISAVTMFDRFYYAPLTTKNEHSPGAYVSVYDGLVAGRQAAGAAPSGATMGVTEPGAGTIEAGIHLFAFAFETASGFITPPGPAAWTSLTAAGSKNANLTGIFAGPAGTLARHVLATKVIPTYTDPQENFELFFVPGGRIADNVTTTLTVDFFDTELVSSADYLLSELPAIPAGPLFVIGHSLGVAGYRPSAVGPTTPDQRSVALVSVSSEPENFSEDEGFIIAKPGYGGNLYNGLDLNGTLYLFKDFMTLVTQPDPNSPPSEWPVGVVDSINGTGPFGIATFMGVPFVYNSGVPVLTHAGLQFFDGSYSNLSDVIDERWRIAASKDFNTSIAVVDPIERRVYMMLPALSGYPDTFLVADFKLGFTPDKIRWSPWTIPNQILRGMVNDRDGRLILSTSAEHLIRYTERGAGATTESIYSFIETFKARFSDRGEICQFTLILIGGEGSGPLALTWNGKDETPSLVEVPITLSLNPGKYLKRLTNFVSPMASLKLESDHAVQAGSFMSINGIKLFGTLFAEEYPD